MKTKRLAIVLGASLLSMTATSCAFPSIKPASLEELSMNVTEFKTFVKGDRISDGVNIELEGFYSNGETKELSLYDVDLSYKSVETGDTYSIGTPIPAGGEYVLTASKNGVSVTREYNFIVEQYHTYIESIELEEGFMEGVDEITVTNDEAIQIPLTISPANFTEPINFEFDTSLATVKWVGKGVLEVKGKMEGRLDLHLSFQNIKDLMKSLVIPIRFLYVYIEHIDVIGPTKIGLGELATFNLNVRPYNFTVDTWATTKSNGVKISKINNTRYRVFGKKIGYATIQFHGWGKPVETADGQRIPTFVTASYQVLVMPVTEQKTDEELYQNRDIIDSRLSSKNDQYNAFWNYSNNIEIEIDFTNEVIKKFRDYGMGSQRNDNFEKNEMYHPCNVKITINGVTNTYYEVGARMRGNTSRNYDFVNDDGTFNNHEFCHFKLNFGQMFLDGETDYYTHTWTNNGEKKARDDRLFAGMKKIDLKWNKNYDYSFTREAYALQAFRNEGIVAQNSNLVHLTVKTDTDFRTEIYQAYEAIDKKLLRRYYGSGDANDGDLYKCTYVYDRPADMLSYDGDEIGVEGPHYRPVYALKTNETSSKHTRLKNFFNKIHEYRGKSGEEFYNEIQSYMNIDYFLRYSALSWVLGLPDDLRNNFNNYYIYFTEYGKAEFIPYDLDRCFGILQDWAIDCKNQAWNDKTALGTPGQTQGQSPLIFRFITGGSLNSWPVYEPAQRQYYQYCVEYARKYLDVTEFRNFTNKVEASNKKIYIGGGAVNINGHFNHYDNNVNDTFSVYAKYKKATLGL